MLWQHDADVADLTELGSTTEGAFRRTAAAEGYASLFRAKREEYARQAQPVGPRAKQPVGPTILGRYDGPDDRILPGSSDPPDRGDCAVSHADLLEIIDRAGLWDAFEEWKIALVDRIHQSGAGVWDFTDYDEYSTEEVPTQRGSSAAMQWFWEPVHFKKALGNKVLQRILTGEPSEFGVLITPENVRAHLTSIRAARQVYRDQGRSGHAHLTEAFPAISR